MNNNDIYTVDVLWLCELGVVCQPLTPHWADQCYQNPCNEIADKVITPKVHPTFSVYVNQVSMQTVYTVCVDCMQLSKYANCIVHGQLI